MSRAKLYVYIDEDGNQKRAVATNYIDAARKMNITPYQMRTYGHISRRKP